MVKLSTIFFILAVVASAHGAQWNITVESESLFCTFLPNTPHQLIGDSETTAIPFCTTESPKAKGAKIFPTGFIQNKKFKRGKGFVQVTGSIDGTKYELFADDEGGQYDAKAPLHSTCVGYKYFVSLIEPKENQFCIRCCNIKSKCRTDISDQGCNVIVPPNGTYLHNA
ncbi:9444_t:CDS:1 [Funneliformis geosporum]|uniref:15383_t:CDS:1 n=1 Tax=Funneliformis geosporum TaxID=1117311 RepID=A0A9W4WQ17_9GLOM|nr:9444_t:CDS:1 [Funneliformis geosporum]CAI2177717.1 15383_t:CDS:1 [Funneliformis geosporum]